MGRQRKVAEHSFKTNGASKKGQYPVTFSRVGKVYKYLVPERKELKVGEVEDVGKRGKTEGQVLAVQWEGEHRQRCV